MLSRYDFYPELLRGAALREREPAIIDQAVGGICQTVQLTIRAWALADCR